QTLALEKKLVEDELKRLLEAVYKERTAAAQDGVSRWLPKGYRMTLSLIGSNGSQIFRLGLTDPDGGWIGNPSGGQRAALYLALAVYLIERRRIPTEGPQILMIPEERSCSP